MRILLIACFILFGVVETFESHGDTVKAEEPDKIDISQMHKNYDDHPQGITGQTIIIPQTLNDAKHEVFDAINQTLAADHMPPIEEIILKSGKVIWIQTFIEDDSVNNK